MKFVKMVLDQKQREDNPVPKPRRPQAVYGRASGLYDYIQVCPETRRDIERFSSTVDATKRAIGRDGKRVHGATVSKACKTILGASQSGGWWWRRELKVF